MVENYELYDYTFDSIKISTSEWKKLTTQISAIGSSFEES